MKNSLYMKSKMFWQRSRTNKLVAGIAGLIVLASGYFIISSQAAGFFGATEADGGTATGNAQIVNDSSASGGKAVQFNAPVTPPPGGGGGGGGSTTTCPLPAYPNETCTGVPAGTSLTVVEGDMRIDTANTVVEGKDIRGCVDVRAPGVIIRKSKIAENCNYVVLFETGNGTLTIEDSDLSCNEHNGTAIGDRNVIVRRVNIHGCENGLDIQKDIDIQDSYIHDLTQTGADPHTDGIQLNDDNSNVTIKHNTIYANEGTSSVITPVVENGTTTNLLIQDNLVAGGAYTIYCPRHKNGGASVAGTNVRLINNHFSRKFFQAVGAYGSEEDCRDESAFTGNVYHETGQPL